MNDRDTRRYDMFKRVQTFGDTNAGDFSAGSVALINFTLIDGIVSELELAKAGQAPSANTSKETLLNAVKLDIQNITRTAAAIAQEEPGFADKFSPPANSNEGAILAAADVILLQLSAQPTDSVAEKAAKTALVAKFVAHELDANFVTNLQADRNAVTAAQTEQEGDRESRVSSTAIISELIQKGVKAVNTLDAIMHNKYGSKPEKLAAWNSASHIERDPKRNKAQTTPAPTPTTPK